SRVALRRDLCADEFRRRHSLYGPQSSGETMSSVSDPITTAPAISPLRRHLATCAENRLALASAVVLLAFAVMAIFAPWIAPQDPYETDLFRRLQPPAWMPGGEWGFLLGCDALGRDIFSRIIYGARISIFIGT